VSGKPRVPIRAESSTGLALIGKETVRDREVEACPDLGEDRGRALEAGTIGQSPTDLEMCHSRLVPGAQ
jgi:hypothetical protein